MHLVWTLFFLLFAFNVQAFERDIIPHAPLESYNITASDTHQFVWFRVAKVGTRSILKILLDHQVPLSINDYRVPFDPRKYKEYFKFAFVRNPWERVVSCYLNKVAARAHPRFKECYGKSFDYFVEFIQKQDLETADVHIRLQSRLIPLEHIDFVGRMESFLDDLGYILNLIGLPHVEIPHQNATPHEHYSRYYTEKTKKTIGRLYKEDIKNFGYEFEAQ